MQFDWTINIGHILILISIVATIATIYFAMKMDIKLMSERLLILGGRMINVELELKELTQVAIKIAAADERLTAQTNRINEVERKINEFETWCRDVVTKMQNRH